MHETKLIMYLIQKNQRNLLMKDNKQGNNIANG